MITREDIKDFLEGLFKENGLIEEYMPLKENLNLEFEVSLDKDGMIVLLDYVADKFGKVISVKEFKEVQTVKDLIDKLEHIICT